MNYKLRLLLFLEATFICHSVVYTAVQNDEFVRRKICNKAELETAGSLVDLNETSAIASDINCATHCSRNENCLGILWTSGVSCKFHINPSAVNVTLCSSNESGDVYYERTSFGTFSCGPNGTWDEDNQRCSCSGGFVGEQCDRYAESCAELRTWNYPQTIRLPYYIQPPGFTAPRIVLCSLSSTETRTFVAVNEGDNNFYFDKTWDDYVNGFYNSADDQYWLSLEFLHHFTTNNAISNIRIFYSLMGGNIVYKYGSLQVQGADQNYAAYAVLSSMSPNQARATASVTTDQHNATDGCFSTTLDTFTPFSTPDVDNDNEVSVSCANQSRAGWWFSHCSPNPACSPLGYGYTSANETILPHHIHAPYVDMQSIYDVFARVMIFLVEGA